MNLFSAAEKLAALDHSRIDLHTESCLHSMGKFTSCQACIAVCPAGAIQPGKPPRLEAGKCKNCLACLPVCPTGAFQGDDSVPSLLNCAARLEAESIELICEHNTMPDKGLNGSGAAILIKGCLAGLGVGGFFALFALGFKEVAVRDDACAQCPWGTLKAQIEAHITSTQRLLSAWGWAEALCASGPLEPSALVERPLWESGNPPLSRRDLFRLATRQGQLAAARVLSTEHAVTGKHASHQRLRMLAAIDHFPDPSEDGRSLALEGLGFAVLTISEKCTACGVCALACPTGAFQFASDEDLYYQLDFKPGICIGCEACTAVCRSNAIEVQATPSFYQVFGSQEPVNLISGNLVRCERCNTLYADHSGSHFCPVCEFRQKNPFGSMLPTGFESSPSN